MKRKYNHIKHKLSNILQCKVKRFKRIIIAGGCFWGVEEYFKRLKGVVSTSVGYVNGNMRFPTYEDVKRHRASHAEGCEIIYDPQIISLNMLLSHMFRFIDPFSLNKQGGDEGIQYRTGIYYKKKKDLLIIQSFINHKQAHTKQKIVVEIDKEKQYFLAETYHQEYLRKNPNGYCHVSFDHIQDNEKKL